MKNNRHAYAVLQIRIEPDVKLALEKAAMDIGAMNCSTMVRIIVREWLEKESEKRLLKSAKRKRAGNINDEFGTQV